MAKLATATLFSKCIRSHKRRHINQLDGLRSLMKVFQFKANDFKMLVSDITRIIRHHNFIFISFFENYIKIRFKSQTASKGYSIGNYFEQLSVRLTTFIVLRSLVVVRHGILVLGHEMICFLINLGINKNKILWLFMFN